VLPVTLNRIAPALRAIAFALLLVPGAQAALWVSPVGDDAGPGTEESPFRTIGHARDVVRTLNRDMADDITVFIAGEHHLDTAIEFGPEDSGSNGFNIIYTAAPGEHPVISGALRVTGWSLADKSRNLWSAPSPAGLAATHDLFVNGVLASRTKSRLLALFSKEPADSAATAPDPKAKWKNPDDVVFEQVAAPAIWSERAAASPAFVENAFELLGSPGEWYFDRPARHLYYTPRPGEDLASADVEAAVAQGFVAGAGSKERPIAGLVFKGIRFEYTTWLAPVGDDPASRPRGAVRFSNAAGIQFLEDEFVHLSAPALDLGPGIDGATVEGCLFGDVSWSAVRVSNASTIRLAESRFSCAATDHIDEGAIDIDSSTDVVIEHDQFDHFPTSAVAVTNAGPGAVHRSSNWTSPPMISLTGSTPVGAPPIPAQGIGISQVYRSLEDEQFQSTTVPMPPTRVSAEAEDESAYVTWMPNCRDGGSPVESYSVESSTGARMTISASAFQQTGYVLMNGLGNGHPVSFTVTAVNEVGSSARSLSTSNVTPRQKRKLRSPSEPAALALTPGASGLTVRITPPTADGGSPILSYLVASGTTAAPIVIEGLDVIRSDFTHPVQRTLAKLLPANGSTVSVVAVNIAGEGKPAALILK
jgi:hypothetical protein